MQSEITLKIYTTVCFPTSEILLADVSLNSVGRHPAAWLGGDVGGCSSNEGVTRGSVRAVS